MGLEGLPVDGLRGWNVASVEDEHTIFADVPRGHKGPANGSTGVGIVVDENADVAVVQHGEEVKRPRDGDVHPRRLIPHVRSGVGLKACKEALQARGGGWLVAGDANGHRRRAQRQQKQGQHGEDNEAPPHGG